MQYQRFIRLLILGVAWPGQGLADVSADVSVDVSVRGVSGDAADAVKGYVAGELTGCSEAQRPEFDRLRPRVRTALDALGYYRATLELAWSKKDPCRLLVTIDPGERSQISEWQIATVGEADIAPADQAWLESLKLTDVPFIPGEYETAKRRALSSLKDRGYLDAAFERTDVLVDTDRNVARVDWTLATGPQYTVSELRLQQDTLNEDLFRKFVDLKPGEPLLADKVLSTYENLVASDYFARVRVNPLLDERTEGSVPVSVEADRTPPWSVLGGVGFATDSGPRLRAQANARYLNRYGHRFGSSALLSPVLGQAKAEYRWPYGDPKHQWYSVESRVDYEDTDTSTSETYGIGLRRVTRLSRKWTQTTYTDYVAERFDVATQEGQSQLWLVGANLTYTSSIDAPRPRFGRSLSVDVRGAHSALLSDTNVVQVRMQARQILPFIAGTRWLFRADAGATWQRAFDELPASLRFFAGGDKSVRGFALESLGPMDADGNVIGGERLLTGSAELDIPVRKNWSVALFTDVGSAFDTEPEFSQSVGIGLRWFSPLGPVRLDLAHPLEDSEQVVRIHVSLGPDI